MRSRPATDTTIERPPRILLVSHDFIEPGLARQAEALAEVCDLQVAAPDHAEVLVFGDIPVERMPAHTTLHHRIRLFGSQYLMASPDLGLRRIRPDVVHIHYDPWAATFWQARIATRLFAPHAALVCSAKKNTYRRYEGPPGRAKAALARAGLRSCDHVMAASEMAALTYRREFGTPQEKISVTTRIGVDTNLFAPARRDPPETITVGYCGRLAEHKGVTDLVDAVRRLAEQGRPVRLRLLGEGALRQSLVREAEEDPWLEVAGPVPSDRVADFMRSIDIFVLPSRVLRDHEEHDAHALLQALAAGLPAIGTRSGIIPEILDEPIGRLVDAESPEQLARSIAELAGEPQIRERLATAARRRALERYSLEAVAEGYLATYRAALAARRT